MQSDYESIVVRSSDRLRWSADDPRLIRRLSCFSVFTFRGRVRPAANPGALYHACQVRRGHHWHRWPLRLIKARAVLRPGR
jgi:hypothetical protein